MQMERSNDSRLKEDELGTNILEIKTDKVRAIVDVIKAISFKETATLDVLNKGFRIIVDDMGMCQAVAYLESTIFQSYARSENFKFDIPLRALTESLSLLDGQGQVFQMKYAKDDIYLDCILEVDGVVIGSRIRILDTDEQSTGNFVFDSNVVVARVMMRTALIHDLFKDMDTSSSALFIEVNKTGISFITIGDMGKVTTTIPSKSVLMDAIDCPVPIRHRYRMGMMRRMTQALSIAEKVSLRFDSEGVLGAQFIIRHESCGEGNEIFTEFFCVPDYEESG